jgi:hypothetical protein
MMICRNKINGSEHMEGRGTYIHANILFRRQQRYGGFSHKKAG